MADSPIPCIEDLRNSICYDSRSGKLHWRERAGDNVFNGRYAGRPALDAPHKSGYRCGRFRGWSLLAHRAAWAIHYGQWPADEIDHINGDKADNRIANLRDVDRETNCKNKKRRSDNVSGVSGVRFDTERRKWTAHASISGKWRLVGAFETMSDAIEARMGAQAKHGYHANNGRTDGGTIEFHCSDALTKTVRGGI